MGFSCFMRAASASNSHPPPSSLGYPLLAGGARHKKHKAQNSKHGTKGQGHRAQGVVRYAARRTPIAHNKKTKSSMASSRGGLPGGSWFMGDMGLPQSTPHGWDTPWD